MIIIFVPLPFYLFHFDEERICVFAVWCMNVHGTQITDAMIMDAVDTRDTARCTEGTGGENIRTADMTETGSQDIVEVAEEKMTDAVADMVVDMVVVDMEEVEAAVATEVDMEVVMVEETRETDVVEVMGEDMEADMAVVVTRAMVEEVVMAEEEEEELSVVDGVDSAEEDVAEGEEEEVDEGAEGTRFVTPNLPMMSCWSGCKKRTDISSLAPILWIHHDVLLFVTL